MAKFGWIVAVEQASHLDHVDDAGKSWQLFTVNLVRPWCDLEIDPMHINGGRGPKLQDAEKLLGELLAPWKWKDVKWDVYGAFPPDGGGALEWRKITGEVNECAQCSATNASVALDAISMEIGQSTQKCEFPFSQALEDLQGADKDRSYVHALAPMTHWPAAVSGALLKLTWFLKCDPGELSGCEQVVCFPSFEMQPSDGIPAATKLQPEVPRTENAVGAGISKTQTVAGYNEALVGFAALAARYSPAPAVPHAQGLLLSQGSPSRSAMVSLLAANLLPLRIVARWLEMRLATVSPDKAADDPVLRKGLVQALSSSMSTGFEYELAGNGVTQRMHLVEFFVEPAKIADAVVLRAELQTFQGPSTTVAAASFDSAIRVLKARKPSPQAWSIDQEERWRTALDEFEKLGKTQSSAEFVRAYQFMLALLSSDEGMCELLNPWFVQILEAPLANAAAQWTPVKTSLLASAAMRLDLLARVQAAQIGPAQCEAASKADQGDAAAAAELLKAAMAALQATVGDDAWAILAANGIEAAARDRVKKLLTDLFASRQSSRARPKDRGIKLDFSAFDTGAGTDSDQRLRGYAIALCSGYEDNGQWKADKVRAAWITDTAMRLASGDWLSAKNAKGVDEVVWMHEAVGATLNDGQRVVSVEYDGAPVATAQMVDGKVDYSGDDPDGFKAVDFAWHEKRELPLLGYGLHYGAVATAIDNAGAIVDPIFRQSHPTQLSAAPSLNQWTQAPSLQYLSSEAPGAPVLGAEKSVPAMQWVPEALYELSTDTQAYAYQAQELARSTDGAAPELRDVALIAFAQRVGPSSELLFPGRSDRCRFEAGPPGTHSAFIERWLNTDRLLLEVDDHQHLSDQVFIGLSSESLKEFARSFREKKVKGAEQGHAYHPAISAIGIEVFSPGERTWQDVIGLERTGVENGKLVAKQPRIAVEVTAVQDGQALKCGVAGRQVNISLPQGRFVRVRLYSLVKEHHFGAGAGTAAQRYAADLRTPGTPTFAGYRAFGPTECWMETLPAWQDGQLPQNQVSIELEPPAETPNGLVSPNLLIAAVKFKGGGPWASWIKGVHAQRHEWHWTCYPLELPQGSTIESWLPSMAGVQSYREMIDFELPTSSAGAGWTLGTAAGAASVFHRWALPGGARPAKYTSYFVRPMLRFRRWLNPRLYDDGPAVLEKHLYAAGSLVAGRLPAGSVERLPTPALRHAIPLTANYASLSAQLVRETNGVMLVFDDALKRTDDFARVGGIGDTLEIDLVETREEQWNEIGTNPIMHGLAIPGAKAAATVTAAPAFGLTFDIGLNPKVAQTAVIVRPVNSEGRWMLAKVRTRRLILPETELGTLLQADKNALSAPTPGAGMTQLAALPTRRQGEEMVPADISIDVAHAGASEVHIVAEGGGLFKVKLPASPASPPADLEGDFRYLLSWHKARWDNGGPARWRCQAMLQRRAAGRLEWTTLPGTVRGFQNKDSQLPETASITRCWLLADMQLVAAKVRRVRLSDYTEPSWLTFIGSFDQSQPGMGRDYRIDMRAGTLSGPHLVDGATVEVPVLRSLGASLASDDPRFHLVLVFRPVPDITRTQTSEESGALVGAYIPGNSGAMTFLPHFPGQTPPADLSGCHAHVVTFQRITALSTNEKSLLTAAATLSDLLDQAFPNQPEDGARESLVRMLPEFIGPIPIAVNPA